VAKIPLSKTTKFIVDNRGRTAPTADSGIPLIATNCVNNKNLYPVYENIRYVSKETYETWFRSHPQPNDILITLKGSQNGAVCLVPNPVDFAIAQDMVALRADENVINPLFLFAALRSEDVQHQIKNLDVSGVIPHFKKGDFDKLLIPYPDKDLQKTIGDTYFNFSKKIDLLQRQNKILEALAETLFRQWFVEEAEESWETASLFDVVELVGGGTPKTDIAEYWDGDIKWVSAKDITPNHKKFIVDTEKKITEQGLSNSAAKLLPKYATIISARGTVGNYCLLSESMAFSQSNYGIKPRFKDCYFFTYLLIANAVEELQSAAYGSVFDTITTSTFKEHQIKIPGEKEIQSFDTKVKLYFEKMLSNEVQIRSLKTLRDTLLPKLMSGEARVKTAEAETAIAGQ
jgi:type I restriction enzyme S subunit